MIEYTRQDQFRILIIEHYSILHNAPRGHTKQDRIASFIIILYLVSDTHTALVVY